MAMTPGSLIHPDSRKTTTFLFPPFSSKPAVSPSSAATKGKVMSEQPTSSQVWKDRFNASRAASLSGMSSETAEFAYQGTLRSGQNKEGPMSAPVRLHLK